MLEHIDTLLYTCQNIHPGYTRINPYQVLAVDIKKWNLLLNGNNTFIQHVAFKGDERNFVRVAVTGMERNTGNFCLLVGTSSDFRWNTHVEKTYVILLQSNSNVYQLYKTSVPVLFESGGNATDNKLIDITTLGWVLRQSTDIENGPQVLRYYKLKFHDTTKTVTLQEITTRTFQDIKLYLETETRERNEVYYLDRNTTNVHCYNFVHNSWSIIVAKHPSRKSWVEQNTRWFTLSMSVHKLQLMVLLWEHSSAKVFYLNHNVWSTVDVTGSVEKFSKFEKQFEDNRLMTSVSFQFFASSNGNIIARCDRSCGLRWDSTFFRMLKIQQTVDPLKEITLKCLSKIYRDPSKRISYLDELLATRKLPLSMVDKYFGPTVQCSYEISFAK